MIEPPLAMAGQRVERGPYRVRSELRWDVSLDDGTQAVLGQLLPEVASDEAVRRRYVYETERLAAIAAPRLARVLAVGPEPDPRDVGAEPPWRLREAPVGQRLDQWLTRAPVAVDEAIERVAALADTVHGVHCAGAVLRDLEPRAVVVTDSGEVWLTDVGLARVDILSTRTASSLILEGSPYAAPEHLRATVVDVRADVYTLGVILWQAVTGTTPFGDGPGFLRAHALPRLVDLLPHSPPGLESLLRACLAELPEQRLASARDVAEALRGARVPSIQGLERVTCQACDEPLRPGLRLCLNCGKTAIKFEHEPGDAAENYSVCLTKAKEDEEFVALLHRQLEILAEGVPDNLNFLVGDARMYSKQERAARIKLPACLFRDLSLATAESLAARLRAAGFAVAVKKTRKWPAFRRVGNWLLGGGAVTAVGGFVLAATASPYFAFMVIGGVALGVAGLITRAEAGKKAERIGLARLRAAPAALPASDPMVARLAGLLGDGGAGDVRNQVAELALLVQRLCDHQALLAGDSNAAAELGLLSEPLERIIELIEVEVGSVKTIDGEVGALDEGGLVRAIAASEARGEPRSSRVDFLRGLDRLRALEDQRGAHFHNLLEAGSLLAKIVDLGLDVDNPRLLAINQTRMALAALGAGPDE